MSKKKQERKKNYFILFFSTGQYVYKRKVYVEANSIQYAIEKKEKRKKSLFVH
jgi:hypothetical protein